MSNIFGQHINRLESNLNIPWFSDSYTYTFEIGNCSYRSLILHNPYVIPGIYRSIDLYYHVTFDLYIVINFQTIFWFFICTVLFGFFSTFWKFSQFHILVFQSMYSLNKKEWMCSLFKEWILEKSEIRVNVEWTFVLFTHFRVTSGITRNPWVIPVVTPKWVNNTNSL